MAAIKRHKPISPRPAASTSRVHGVWYKLFTALLVFVNSVIALGVVISCYAGDVNPVSVANAPVVAMTFPFFAVGAVVLMLFTLFFRKWVALIPFGALLASCPAVAAYMPLHLPAKTAGDDNEFTVMSYNVYQLYSQDGTYPGGCNPTLSYILAQDADIVCLQELNGLNPAKDRCITQAQIDSIHAQYPYVYIGGHAQGVFSKFPIEPVQTGFEYADRQGAADMSCFRARIKGHNVTVFNVHLQSFYLVASDRKMFRQLATFQADEHEVDDMRRHLMDKIRSASRLRVDDTSLLLRYVRKYGGPNVIVCGDFNDVPHSYPIKLLSQAHLKEVYPQVGFGPMITYNAGGFYFRIDHILYRGALDPVAMTRGSLRSSDHYPITATFRITDK